MVLWSLWTSNTLSQYDRRCVLVSQRSNGICAVTQVNLSLMRTSFITHTWDEKGPWWWELHFIFMLLFGEKRSCFYYSVYIYKTYRGDSLRNLTVCFLLSWEENFQIEQTHSPQSRCMIHLLYDSNAIWKHSCYAKYIRNARMKHRSNLSARHLFEPKINVLPFVLS